MKKKKEADFLSLFRNSWKLLLSIGIALGLVSSFFSLDSRYQKAAVAEQEKQQIIKSFEQLNKSLEIQQQVTEEKLKKQNLEFELKILLSEEKRLYDRERTLKKDLEKYPNDKRIKEELEETQREREDVRKQIFELKSKMR